MRSICEGALWRVVALLSCSLAPALRAQTSPTRHHWEPVAASSGVHANPNAIEGVVWSQFVILPPGTPWLRLYYHAVNLDKGSYLRITSVLDGQTMLMRQPHLPQWGNSSCYFNGAGVFVELVAGPNTQGNFVDIRSVMAGDNDPGPQGPETICGATDNRVLSSDVRAGRIDPIGCTGWIIDVPASGLNKLHLSAGHCVATGQVLQFAVPASAANCALVFPPPAKQFAIDTATDASANIAIGNDWWVFRCFPNSTTGLTTFQEQGSAFDLAAVLPANGTTLRITGFGLDGTDVNSAPGANASCTCTPADGTGTRNQVEQTHTGPLSLVTGVRLDYMVDTCGGNSGSPVINNVTGLAIGIHTNAGCSTVAGSTNSGTSILNAGLQAALTTVAPPVVSNDDCINAIPVAVGVNGPFSTVGASNSAPAFPCGGGSAGRDAWFSFDTCAGSHTFRTCTPTRNFDTVLQVFSGSCGALVSAGCNDDACDGLGSSLTLTLGSGSFLIRVGGFGGASGDFDLVIQRPEIYDAGPIVSDPTGGSGGAPASVLQTAAPFSMTTFGYSILNPTFSLADDFMTNGTWCVSAIEVFSYQTTAVAPTITGVFLEIYDGDPSTTGVPIAGSPGLANNLVTTSGYTVTNTLTGIYRVTDTAPADTGRQVQSVLVGLPSPLSLNSAALPSGRYFLRMRATGSLASGPFVPPITVKNSPPTGDMIQSNVAVWATSVNGAAGNTQGLPFKLYGTSTSMPGSLTNLGGGCSPTTLEVRGAPHVGGVVHIEMVGPNPAAVPLIILGFSNPNASFAPACACVLRASLDVLNVGTSFNWQVPAIAAGLGFELFTQGDQVFNPALACDIGIGIRFELTDAWRIRLY